MYFNQSVELCYNVSCVVFDTNALYCGWDRREASHSQIKCQAIPLIFALFMLHRVRCCGAVKEKRCVLYFGKLESF